MNTIEINGLLGRLNMTSALLEEEYMDNGGEVTESTLDKEADIEAIRGLLTNDAIDDLGRWLKRKEDEAKAYKAEKDFIDRRIRSCGETVDYIKELISRIMSETGVETVKGHNGYSFRTYTSEKTSVDKERLAAEYGDTVREALDRAGIPSYVTFTLGASVKAVPEGERLPDIFLVTREDTVRFTKPRANKES